MVYCSYCTKKNHLKQFLILSGQGTNYIKKNPKTYYQLALAAGSCHTFAAGMTLHFISYEMQLHLNIKHF